MPKANALLVVAKRPTPGHTKTRLCPPLTHAQAADLYECFLQDTLDLMRKVSDVECIVGFLPEDEQDYFRGLAPEMQLNCQRGASLGERLDHLLTDVLAGGSQRAVVMDSDSPTLPAEYVAQAFRLLDEADVVLGPTLDGGYYLIGMKQPQPLLLRRVRMSTPQVLADTLELAGATGITVSMLPAWYDVDTIDDLRRLEEEFDRQDHNGAAAATRRWLKAAPGHSHRP